MRPVPTVRNACSNVLNGMCSGYALLVTPRREPRAVDDLKAFRRMLEWERVTMAG